jgi:hypothetical protein
MEYNAMKSVEKPSDVSDKHVASIFRIEQKAKQEITAKVDGTILPR